MARKRGARRGPKGLRGQQDVWWLILLIAIAAAAGYLFIRWYFSRSVNPGQFGAIADAQDVPVLLGVGATRLRRYLGLKQRGSVERICRK